MPREDWVAGFIVTRKGWFGDLVLRGGEGRRKRKGDARGKEGDALGFPNY